MSRSRLLFHKPKPILLNWIRELNLKQNTKQNETYILFTIKIKKGVF